MITVCWSKILLVCVFGEQVGFYWRMFCNICVCVCVRWVAFSSEGFRGHQCVLEEGEYADCMRLFGGTELSIQSLRYIQTVSFPDPFVSSAALSHSLSGLSRTWAPVACFEGQCLAGENAIEDQHVFWSTQYCCLRSLKMRKDHWNHYSTAELLWCLWATAEGHRGALMTRNISVRLSLRISWSRQCVWRAQTRKSKCIRTSKICRKPTASAWGAEREEAFHNRNKSRRVKACSHQEL